MLIVENEHDYIDWAASVLDTELESEKARSGAHSVVFELKAKNARWFMKIADNLKPEYDRLKWLEDKGVSTPRALAFNSDLPKNALIMSAVDGTDLAHLSSVLTTEGIIEKLVAALH